MQICQERTVQSISLSPELVRKDRLQLCEWMFIEQYGPMT